MKKHNTNLLERKMFCLVPNIHTALRLPAGELKVYVAICKYMNKVDGQAWPKQESLAEDTGYSRQQIGVNISKLVQRGLITSQPRLKNSLKRENVYRVVKVDTGAVDEPEPEYDSPDYEKMVREIGY